MFPGREVVGTLSCLSFPADTGKKLPGLKGEDF